jgi:hypothetical protein
MEANQMKLLLIASTVIVLAGAANAGTASQTNRNIGSAAAPSTSKVILEKVVAPGASEAAHYGSGLNAALNDARVGEPVTVSDPVHRVTAVVQLVNGVRVVSLRRSVDQVQIANWSVPLTAPADALPQVVSDIMRASGYRTGNKSAAHREAIATTKN